MPLTFKIHLIAFLFLFSYVLKSQNQYHRFGIEQKVIATDFIQAPNRISKITSLPRGIELTFKKYTDSKSFLQIPIRVGFSRASNLDTFTTGKAFYGLDMQYGKIFSHYKIAPFLSTGLGVQRLNRQWGVILPLNIGIEVPIDSAFFLSFHAGYRHATKRVYSTIQYGLGVSFKIGKRKPITLQTNILPNDSISINNADSLMVNTNSRVVIEIKELIRLKPKTPTFKQIKNFTQENINAITKNNSAYLQELQSNIFLDKQLELANHIQFKTNSSDITLESVTALKKLAEFLLSKPDISFRIEGHTDNTGSEAYNLRLSILRAKTCHDYLVKFGVADKRILTEGWGERRPKADNKTDKGRAINRRVEIYQIF